MISTRSFASLAAAGAIALALLTGCSTDPALSEPTATELQALVHDVASGAAADDHAAAVASLDALQSRIDTAIGSGAVTEERAAEIRALIALVREDLAALAPSPPPAPVVTPEPTPTDETGDDDGAGDNEGDKGDDRGDDKGDDDKPGKGND